MTDEPLSQLFAGPLIGSVKVLGVDVKLRTLTNSETLNVIAWHKDEPDVVLRTHQQMRSTLTIALLTVGGNPLPEDTNEKLALIASWKQSIIEKLAAAYEELRIKEQTSLVELKNA